MLTLERLSRGTMKRSRLPHGEYKKERPKNKKSITEERDYVQWSVKIKLNRTENLDVT